MIRWCEILIKGEVAEVYRGTKTKNTINGVGSKGKVVEVHQVLLFVCVFLYLQNWF